jgi:chromosomal replication initiation ATPase DnaA
MDAMEIRNAIARVRAELATLERLVPIPIEQIPPTDTKMQERGARAIINGACKEFMIDELELHSERRNKRVVKARSIIYLRIRQHLSWSYPRIGKLFGQHHTTVMHGINLALQKGWE